MAQPAPSGDPGPVTIVTLGDSLTAGYKLPREAAFTSQLEAALRERGYDVRVPNTGVSGETTAGGLSRLDWLLGDKPDLVIVALGGNDGLRGLPPAQMRANLAAILDALGRRNIATLLAGMLPPPNLGGEYGREFTGVFEGLARERPDVVFYPFLLDGVAGEARLNQPDRIHPTAEGAELIARRMLPFIETLLDRVRVSASG